MIALFCYLFLADFIDRVAHNSNEGIEKNDDGEKEVQCKETHGHISRHCWIPIAAKLINSSWVENVPEKHFDSRSEVLQLLTKIIGDISYRADII